MGKQPSPILTQVFNNTFMTISVVQKIVLIGSLLFTISLNVAGCALQKTTVKLSSGSPGSGYQRISSQIDISANDIKQIDIIDNYNSQGSQQNLQRLLNKEVDFAIVQLDVASEAMKAGKVNTLLVLTQEYLHLITQANSNLQTLADLPGKRVMVGAEGSGIYFTAKRIFEASNLNIIEVKSNEDRLQKLIDGEIDAFVYVGPLATSETFKQALKNAPQLKFIPIDSSLINYLTIQFPESYQGSIIPKGTYKPLPQLPSRDLPTISTPGALITRPDVDKRTVSLLTWAIIANFRQYSPFYPELATEKGVELLNEGLIYIHPGAQKVFNNGDPRVAWQRYLQENKPLQAAFIMLISTSTVGFLIRWWRKKRQTDILNVNRQTITELQQLLNQNPQKASEEIEELRQQYRLMLIEGTVAPDVYEQIEKMTLIFAEQCQRLQNKQKHASLNQILQFMNEWDEELPFKEQEKLQKSHQKCQEMLKTGKLDLPTYLQMTQLSLAWTNLLLLFSLKNK